MASPPGSATSPTGTPLALPRQRPKLALPGQHSRKSSIASGTLSAHPLRQTSFPPQESLARSKESAAFSPDEDLDDFSDNEINSAISGPAGDDGLPKKRKRGERGGRRGRGGRGTGVRTGSVSLVNGDDGRSTKRGGTAGAPSVVNAGDEADGEEEEEEDETAPGGGRVPLYEGGQMSAAEVAEERELKRLFYESVPEPHRYRAESYYRAKLLKGDVRKLVNHTLSQSVPVNVVLVVASYTKLFAGTLIEEARRVQAEWAVIHENRPDGGPNKAHKRLRRTYGSTIDEDQPVENGTKEVNGTNGDSPSEPKPEEADSRENTELPNGTAESTEKEEMDEIDLLFPGGAGGLSKDIEECDLGPLLPDHLREALRRYKKSRGGGVVGFTGMSLEGREVAAARNGGRRLFR